MQRPGLPWACSWAWFCSCPPSTAGEGDASSFDEEPLFGAIRQAIIAELKDKYQDDKHWGHTTKALSSVRLRGRERTCIGKPTPSRSTTARGNGTS